MNSALVHNMACRVCNSLKLKKVLSFGPTPPANAFLSADNLREAEQYFPLDAYLCGKCGLLQLIDIVSPRVLFKDYIYVSSTSSVFVAHFRKLADEVAERFGLNARSLVIDIGSNDGILLLPFKEKGIQVLGIEPDKPIARMAERRGIKTVPRFFDVSLAKNLVKRYGQADIITATNVFAHINDIHEAAQGVRILLKKKGVFIIEVPYLVDFLRKILFDTVYHEHLSYFSVSSLNTFFEKAGMRIIDVKRVQTHGGSLRVFAQRRGLTPVVSAAAAELRGTARIQAQINPSSTAKLTTGHGADEEITDAVGEFLRREKKLELRNEEVYKKYALRIQENRAKLISLLVGLRKKGKRIAGYGAPAKGNTLLNYFSIGNDLIDYIVDDSRYKQGKHTPGKRIQVVPPERLRADPPDFLLLLAWNFADSIMLKNEWFRKRGGKFIVPVPTPRIIV